MFKRALSMTLSLLLSVSTTAAMVPRAVQEPRTVTVRPPWAGELRMVIRTEADQLTLRLPDGSFVERLTVNDRGETATPPLQPGQYLLEAEAGRSLVSLRENASVAVLDGIGWADGEIVHFTQEFAGMLHVVCYGEPGEAHSFTLDGVENGNREIQFHTSGQNGLLFSGLAEGTYDLYMDGTFLQQIAVTPAQPIATVTVEKVKGQEKWKGLQ